MKEENKLEHKLENKADHGTGRKEWIKNIAIIFLSIMLVLTFFSNTIMNYSLPEVATVNIQPGSITAKIRGTGNLVSEDPYKITIQETRTIASVAVKAGDTVEKDQVLFYLEDKESQELETAEKELNELILAYSTAILKGDITDNTFDRIQAGVMSSNQEYQDRINAAKLVVETRKETLNSIDRQIAIADGAVDNTSDGEAQLAHASTELEKAQALVAEREAALAQAKTESGGDALALTQEKHKAEEVVNEKLTALTGPDGMSGLRKELEDAMNAILATLSPAESVSIKKPGQIKNINNYIGTLSELYEKAKNNNIAPDAAFQGNLSLVVEKMDAYRRTFDEYKAAKLNFNNAKEAAAKVMNAKTNLASLESSVNEAKNLVNEWQVKINAIKNEISDNQEDKADVKASLALSRQEAEAQLKAAEEELNQILTDVSSELNLGNQNSIIREKREEIQKLKEKSQGTVIKAPVAGVVTAVNKTAGEAIQPEEELAIMQPEGKGYSMSFSVTAEQAKKVKVGEKAEVQNAWFYDNIEATLTGIRPDPAEPSQKKLLVFDVKGDVQAGQSISLSIGQKSADYDMLVPNSAVKEDNQGKFILIIESKNSPLGNRYIATRVGVEVLGADDLKTAINAALQGYEYVITTATQPVEAGKQVRLAESD